ncbi:MAG: hypothetical protein U5Q44_06395 [Dehalococcoidia bacterium]|nr:hypothetical protein [Dehalococcoidia bacterium]
MTLLAAVNSSYGTTTGPLTLTIGAPLVGGNETQGMYQLFLPTP